jgi:hypothetical protein
VWYYGSKASETGNSMGIQPIIYKTTNSGLTWSGFPSINFNDKATFKAPVLDHLFPAFNDTARILPFFNYVEGMEGTVDANDQLHIVTTLLSSNRSHPDSLFGPYSFPNWDGETYAYAHGLADLSPYDATVRMNRPYIYDFYSTASGWKVAIVDSMGSEAPGERSTDDGFADNPWDATGGTTNTKVNSEARLQLSRTPGGSKILFTWSESDSGFTNQGRKWNHVNNVHVRMLDVNPSFNTPAYAVHAAEYNITEGIPYIKGRAQMHQTSPRCAVTLTTPTSYTVTLPIKVSNNQSNPMAQLNPVTHWYTSAALEFTVQVDTTGISEMSRAELTSELYPNPAIQVANVKVLLNNPAKIEVVVRNIMGQTLGTSAINGQEGENRILLNTEGLGAGIYLVNISAGNASTTKKLIIE